MWHRRVESVQATAPQPEREAQVEAGSPDKTATTCSPRRGRHPVRDDGYKYGANGTGVCTDLVQATVAAWSSLSYTSDPASPLRSVNDGAIHSGTTSRPTGRPAVPARSHSHRL